MKGVCTSSEIFGNGPTPGRLTWNRAKSSMRRVYSSDLLLQLTFKCGFHASIWHGLRFAVLILRREVDCLCFKSRSNRLSSLHKKTNDGSGQHNEQTADRSR